MGRSSGRAGDGVTLFLPNLDGGGAERMMASLARGLSARGVKVDLVLARAYGSYLDEVPPEVRVVDLGSDSVLAGLPRLARHLRAARPAVAMGTLPYASLALLWAARAVDRRLPVFIREASTPSMVRPEPGDLKTRGALWLSRIFYRRANGVIAVSKGVADDVHRFLGVPRDRITTIYNPVVPPDLSCRAAQEIDDPWFCGGSPPVILSVARLGPEKDFPTLLRAFARVRAQRDARLLILGEGTERGRLERLADELGIADAVRMPGFVGNPLPYMARAAVYALSSEREGLPGSMIQAMACGCPVVSTDCPSGPREVLEDGRLGPLVAVGDHEALAAAILAVLDRPVPAERLRERSRSFTEEQSIDAYMSLFFGHS